MARQEGKCESPPTFSLEDSPVVFSVLLCQVATFDTHLNVQDTRSHTAQHGFQFCSCLLTILQACQEEDGHVSRRASPERRARKPRGKWQHQ